MVTPVQLWIIPGTMKPTSSRRVDSLPLYLFSIQRIETHFSLG